MATTAQVVDGLPPSHQQALSILQRSESTTSTDVEKGQLQQEVLNMLSNKTTANDVGKIMAHAALDVDRAFDSVQLILSLSENPAFLALFPHTLLIWGQIRQALPIWGQMRQVSE